MSLEKLKDKYGIKTDQCDVAAHNLGGDCICPPDADLPDLWDPDEELQSWKDSAPVIRLSEYLKSNPQHGIKLYQENGKPILSFDPGLRGGKNMDVERWSVACQAVDLYHGALMDLDYLLSHGLIDIPTKPERGD